MNRKTVVVTGAAGGMGTAACRLLTEQGYTVIGLDAHPPKESVGWRMILADLTKEDEVLAAADAVRQEYGTVSAIIHHAGVYDLNSLVEIPEAEFIRIFDVNVFGAYRVNRAFLPLLEQGGRIVLTSSELAPLDPLPFTGLYALTKTAVEKYADALRSEVQLLGYSVSVIRPGAVRTGLLSVSTARLDRFCETTTLYPCNAARFRRIVDSVESRTVEPEAIAKLDLCALTARCPKYLYSVNRNPLLRLLSILPKRAQARIIRTILKK